MGRNENSLNASGADRQGGRYRTAYLLVPSSEFMHAQPHAKCGEPLGASLAVCLAHRISASFRPLSWPDNGFAASTDFSLHPIGLVGMAEPQRDSRPPTRNELGEFDPNAILTVAPQSRFKLGYGSIMGIVINGMIGSGIFDNAGSVYAAIDSTGVALMLWLSGLIYTVAGVIVLIEYGLTVPRTKIGDRDRALPRSGGMLNYVGSPSASALANGCCSSSTCIHVSRIAKTRSCS